MALHVLPRIFKYNAIELDDPDPKMTPEDVKTFYSNIYPELTQAQIEGPEMGEASIQYNFRRAYGTKGNEITVAALAAGNNTSSTVSKEAVEAIELAETLGSLVMDALLESGPRVAVPFQIFGTHMLIPRLKRQQAYLAAGAVLTQLIDVNAILESMAKTFLAIGGDVTLGWAADTPKYKIAEDLEARITKIVDETVEKAVAAGPGGGLNIGYEAGHLYSTSGWDFTVIISINEISVLPVGFLPKLRSKKKSVGLLVQRILGLLIENSPIGVWSPVSLVDRYFDGWGSEDLREDFGAATVKGAERERRKFEKYLPTRERISEEAIDKITRHKKQIAGKLSDAQNVWVEEAIELLTLLAEEAKDKLMQAYWRSIDSDDDDYELMVDPDFFFLCPGKEKGLVPRYMTTSRMITRTEDTGNHFSNLESKINRTSKPCTDSRGSQDCREAYFTTEVQNGFLESGKSGKRQRIRSSRRIGYIQDAPQGHVPALWGRREPAYFITTHRVDTDGTMGAGAPLTLKFFKEVFKLLTRKQLRPVYIPVEVIAHVPDLATLWWTPASKRYLFFADETGIQSGYAPVPATLFMLSGNHLSTWALKENKRPTPETAIFRSPFFNISEGGDVCMGNIKRPGADLTAIKKWEDAFFGGECTNHGPPVFKGIMAKDLWNKLIAEKANEFPLEYLVPCGQVGDILAKRW